MKKLIIGTIFIAALSLVFGVMNIYNAPVGSVILDVNPSIEIVTNRLDTVIEVRALNNDAEKMLEDFQLDDRDVESVVDELVDLMISTGYITGGEDNLVMLTVYEENANQEVLDRMNKQIKAYLENQKISATILNQVAKDSDEDQDGQTSTGKRGLINKLVDSDDELNYNNLASISIKDIILMSESMGLTPKDLFLQVVEKAEQNISNGENTFISTEEARNIARELTNGGQVVKFEIEEDDSEVYYKVEVLNESGKYEIEIDAMTGKVVYFELDEIDDMYNQTLISRDEAIEIAREISGSGEIEIELEKDDDRYIYEVEVETETSEYEIEIDAVTG
ncbi:MAG: PepSY domain-containing protein, partial [Clostridia bacterium]